MLGRQRVVITDEIRGVSQLLGHVLKLPPSLHLWLCCHKVTVLPLIYCATVNLLLLQIYSATVNYLQCYHTFSVLPLIYCASVNLTCTDAFTTAQNCDQLHVKICPGITRGVCS